MLCSLYDVCCIADEIGYYVCKFSENQGIQSALENIHLNVSQKIY